VATPHVGGPGHNTHKDIKRDELGLIEVPSEIWRDIVFINLNSNAGPFAAYGGDLMARWHQFEGQKLFHTGADSGFRFDVACNWKLAVENFCESYHLPWVHPGLNSYSKLEDHYHIENPGQYSGQGTMAYRAPSAGDGQKFPDFASLSDKWNAGAEYIALYPNALLGVHRDHAFVIILQPVAHDRTIEHVAIYYPQAATGAEFGDLRARNAALWRSVLEEDLWVVEDLQRGRHSPGFDGGRFSPVMDSPTHCFHQWVASRMMDKSVDLS
ncbi:MAG: RHO alpha subunit C-terminal catalytic domain-containing protein, partial [Paracoccaceae bacterium]